jgi:hypothetical protein
VVRVMGPVVAAAGTVAVTWVAPLRVKAALAPLNATFDVFWNAWPVIVTDVPTGPLFGLNPLIVGGFPWAAGLAAAGEPRSATVAHTRPNMPRVGIRDDFEFADRIPVSARRRLTGIDCR